MFNANLENTGATKLRPFLALVIALVCHASMASEPAPQSYSMAAFIDEAYGEEIIAGDYNAAITTLGDKPVRKRKLLPVNNNLCIAYVMANDVANAKLACETAVISARNHPRRDKAIALTNRGVIRALTGDFEGARIDFQTALKLRRKFREPMLNLVRLDSMQEDHHNSSY